MIKIITREQWKARKPKTAYEPHVPNKITIHHQGAPADFPKQYQIPCFEGAKTIRAFQKYHMDANKWNDIGYHLIIAPDGTYYQGRPFEVSGSHVKNNNTGNIGICVIGNFEVEKPTGEQLAALKKAIIHISNLFPSVARGLPKNIFGHRHFMATDCPGANLIDFVNGLKYGSITLFDPEDEKK